MMMMMMIKNFDCSCNKFHFTKHFLSAHDKWHNCTRQIQLLNVHEYMHFSLSTRQSNPTFPHTHADRGHYIGMLIVPCLSGYHRHCYHGQPKHSAWDHHRHSWKYLDLTTKFYFAHNFLHNTCTKIKQFA